MSPEILVAIITAVSVLGAAVVAAFPALRRTHNAVTAQGAETRAATLDALDVMGTRLQARFDARIDDVRNDIDDVREGVSRVREWQAYHDAEHLIIVRPHRGGDGA